MPLQPEPIKPIGTPLRLWAPHALERNVGAQARPTVSERHTGLVRREVNRRAVYNLLLVLLFHVHPVVLVDSLAAKIYGNLESD